ncbi:hypothetical protein SLEP1_g17556 [Rubroshorea leprosula]|uniref:RING-type E3 ubiquitin transferase n=1 Tax=Rubroshorea leprosula TaxID=152421 RepID=A0AAV5J564_9ROSI|nr:hypothetical protein SLEP1_g17556 [Rubroshorea leprosula]
MGDAIAGRYWRHTCARMVNPSIEADINCPFCGNGCVEEMSSTRYPNNNSSGPDFVGSEITLSLWAPVRLALMGGLTSSGLHTSAPEQEKKRISFNTRALQDMRSSSASESGHSDIGRRGSLILLDPFNEEALIVQGSIGSNQGQIPSNRVTISLADYFIGPGLDFLLHHLAENDANRYGTPPEQKEAVEAMPIVNIEENTQCRCSICLEDFEIGSEEREMPCKHKFHHACMVPWLELHSSCPVRQFQLPSNDSKIEANGGRNNEERERGKSSGSKQQQNWSCRR